MFNSLEKNFYITLLQANDQIGVSHLYMFTSVAVSEQEAFAQGVLDCQRKNPAIFAVAMQNGGFTTVGCTKMERNDLIAAYRNIIGEREGELKLFNLVMQHILETKDAALFEKVKASLSTFDQQLLREKLYGLSITPNP